MKTEREKRLDRVWRMGCVIWLVLILAALGILLAVASSVGDINRQSELSARLFSYCVDENTRLEADAVVELCNDWSSQVLRNNPDKVNACNQQSGVLDAPFTRCLSAENLNPPSADS